MKTKEVASEESLRRLWSQIELLRKEIEQAERDRTARYAGYLTGLRPKRCGVTETSNQFANFKD